VTIVVGQTVRWTWTGTDAHSTTSDTNVWDSGIQNGPGATFEFTFNTPGAYPYYCQLHGAPGGVGMSGTVTVKPA
jgi:plastocyanin